MDVRVIYRTCPTCGHRFGQPDDPGRKRRFCSDACKQAAYRQRKRTHEQAHQRAQDDARRRAREDARRQRDRARSHRPPPHAGTSRPGPFCGACGGHRGPHTSTTTRPPTTAPGAATTACTPRPTAPGSPRKLPPAGPRPNNSAPSTASRRRTDRNATPYPSKASVTVRPSPAVPDGS
jgi:endogenous inhibitor of DNA gyrase (YacG/DUF329 family)